MLTGKDVYSTVRPFLERQGVETPDWDDEQNNQEAKEFYNGFAQTLNNSHIMPLQGVVKELVALLEDDELMIEETSDGWYDRKRKAYDTAQQLLKEDIPC